jgi:hypothetical protein
MLFTLANQKTAHCSFYGKNSGSFIASSAAASAMFTQIATHLTNRFANTMNGQAKFAAVTVRDMSNKTNAEFRSTQTAITPGVGATGLPQDMAIVLTAEVVERGRGAKGRLYLPGWATSALGPNGTIQDTVVAAVTAFGGDLLLELNAVALGAAVPKYHRQEYTGLTGALHAERTAHMADVLAYTCQNNEWDTQRRRGF